MASSAVALSLSWNCNSSTSSFVSDRSMDLRSSLEFRVEGLGIIGPAIDRVDDFPSCVYLHGGRARPSASNPQFLRGDAKRNETSIR